MEATHCPLTEEWIRKCSVYIQLYIIQPLKSWQCYNIDEP